VYTLPDFYKQLYSLTTACGGVYYVYICTIRYLDHVVNLETICEEQTKPSQTLSFVKYHFIISNLPIYQFTNAKENKHECGSTKNKK